MVLEFVKVWPGAEVVWEAGRPPTMVVGAAWVAVLLEAEQLVSPKG